MHSRVLQRARQCCWRCWLCRSHPCAASPRASFILCCPSLHRSRPLLQDVLDTFRARDLVIERSTVQRAPINLEVRQDRLLGAGQIEWLPAAGAHVPHSGRLTGASKRRPRAMQFLHPQNCDTGSTSSLVLQPLKKKNTKPERS